MPKSKSPASGKVKVPKWGIMDIKGGCLAKVYDTRYEARVKHGGWNHEHWKIVRLTGTVSYQIAK